MYRELNLYDRTITEEEIIQNFFLAINYEMDGVIAPINFVPKLREVWVDGTVLSTPIDYPHGTSDIEIRTHAIVVAAKKGVTAVDLPINPIYIANGDYSKIRQDIIVQQATCKAQSITLRVMLEYRLMDKIAINDILNILVAEGVEFVLPSTGNMVDDYLDNLLTGLEIQDKFHYSDHHINVITNGHIWNLKQFGHVKDSEIFGVRFRRSAVLPLLKAKV